MKSFITVTILALALMFSISAAAQIPASVTVTVQNGAWYVYNPNGQTVNVVFTTPQGVAFDSFFSVAPGTSMPVMGNTNQQYRWFACFAPYIPEDTGTGRLPRFNAMGGMCASNVNNN